MSKIGVAFLFIFSSIVLSISGQETLDTYFDYSPPEIEALQLENTPLYFTKSALKKWDSLLDQEFEDQPASLDQFRIATYLYVAQEEAAKITRFVKGKLMGSLDPLSYEVIALFLPDVQKTLDYEEDTYSLELAGMIIPKIRARMEQEDARQVSFEVPEDLKNAYLVGLTIANWLPWYAIPARAYFAPPPPPLSDSEFWNGQIAQIKKEQKPLTDEKIKAVKHWAGMDDPKKSDWRYIANDYLFSHAIGLPKILRVRSTLAMTLYDAFIVSFNSKYRFNVLRPSMYDPQLETVIAVPKHPSYPSNHSVISAAAATILSHFFPKQANHWRSLEREACLSRIWGGIHYPIDDEAGREAGEGVAEAVLEQVK